MTELEYRGPEACAITGATYRQIDYWDRLGAVTPTIGAARGSGSRRRYNHHDLIIMRIVKQIVDIGCTLQIAKQAADHLRDQPDTHVLIFDGTRWQPTTNTHQPFAQPVTVAVNVTAVHTEINNRIAQLHDGTLQPFTPRHTPAHAQPAPSPAPTVTPPAPVHPPGSYDEWQASRRTQAADSP